MATILQFPDGGDQTWARASENVVHALAQLGHDRETVALVMEELKPLFLEAWRHPVASPEDVGGTIARLNLWVGGFTFRLLMIAAGAKLQSPTSGLRVAAQQSD